MKKRIIQVMVIVALAPLAILMLPLTIIMLPAAFIRWLIYGNKYEYDTILFVLLPIGLVARIQLALYGYFKIDY